MTSTARVCCTRESCAARMHTPSSRAWTPPRPRRSPDSRRCMLLPRRVRNSYAGAEVLAVAADTEEHALDAVRAVKVDYEVLEHAVKEEDVLKNPERKTLGRGDNLGKAGEETKGDAAAGFKEPDPTIEGEYGIAVIAHQCLEAHGLGAEWGGGDP